MHISQSTKDSLHGEFELEPGNGGERCEYLLEKGINTYLVLAPEVVADELTGNVSGCNAIIIMIQMCFSLAMRLKDHRLKIKFSFLL